METNVKNLKEVLDPLRGQDAYKQTCEMAKFILEQDGCTTPDSAKSGSAVWDSFVSKRDNEGIVFEELAKNTFIQYLCKAAKEKGTNIICQGRKQGYYTADEFEVVEEEDEETDEEGEAATRSGACFRTNEATLYPVIEKWLKDKGFNVKNISSGRRNSKWGNPDVMGLKRYDFLGRISTEIVTIECKKTLDGWQHWIFEAVAHTRFANRSYFAFAHPEDEIQKMVGELFPYAEYFHVGLLVLEVPRDIFNKLVKGDAIETDAIEVVELFPAPLCKPQPEATNAFLEGLGIKSITDLYSFGSELSENPLAQNSSQS